MNYNEMGNNSSHESDDEVDEIGRESEHSWDNTEASNNSHVVGPNFNPTMSDLCVLISNLKKSSNLNIPSILIAEILNWAEYCSHQSVVTRTESTAAQHGNQNIMYLSLPMVVPKYCSIIRIEIKVESKDQGWSSYPEQQGTREGSCTFGEVCMSTNTDERMRVYTNIHAGKAYEKQHIVFETDSDLVHMVHKSLASAKNTEVIPSIQLYVRSMYPGWVHYIRFGEISVTWGFTDWDQFIHDQNIV